MSKTNATLDLFSCDDNTTCKVTFLKYNKGLLGDFQPSQKYIEILNRANIGNHQSTGQPLKDALEKRKVISMYAQSLNPLLRVDFADGDSYLISGFWQDAGSGDYLVTKVHKSITEIVGYGRKLPCVIEFFETDDNKELRSQAQLEGYFINTMKCMLTYYQRGLNNRIQRNFLIEHLRSENSFKRFLEEHIVRQQLEIPVNIKEYGDDKRLFKVVFNDVEYYVFRQKGPDDTHREYYSVTKMETNMQKETENTQEPAEPEATKDMIFCTCSHALFDQAIEHDNAYAEAHGVSYGTPVPSIKILACSTFMRYKQFHLVNKDIQHMIAKRESFSVESETHITTFIPNEERELRDKFFNAFLAKNTGVNLDESINYDSTHTPWWVVSTPKAIPQTQPVYKPMQPNNTSSPEGDSASPVNTVERITALEKEVAVLKEWKSDVGNFFIHPSLREATPSKEFTTHLSDLLAKTGFVPETNTQPDTTAVTNHPEENNMSKPHPSEQNVGRGHGVRIKELEGKMNDLVTKVKTLEDYLNQQRPVSFPAHSNSSVNQNTNHYPWHNPGQNPYVTITELGKRTAASMPAFQTQADQGVPYSRIPFYNGPAICPELLLLHEGKATLCMVHGIVYRLPKDLIIADTFTYTPYRAGCLRFVCAPTIGGWNTVHQSSDPQIPRGSLVHGSSGPSLGLLVRYPGKKYDYQIA